MNSQNNEEDSMNFSVIDRNEERRQCIDFSLESLLQDQPPSKPQVSPPEQSPFPTFNNPFSAEHHPPVVPSSAQACPNDFLRDLSRMEKELSFESQSYNVYQEQASVSQELKSKTMSCMQVTKAATCQSVSKGQPTNYNYYQGTLLIDCRIKKEVRRKGESGDSNSMADKDVDRKEKEQLKEEKLKRKHTSIGIDKLKLSHTQRFYRPNEPTSKDKIIPSARSKSKSTTKLPLNYFKSISHVKTSTEAETFSSKVFTDYYGTQLHVPTQKTKKKKESINTLKSKEKSSKSKQKLPLHSPRLKTVVTSFQRKPKQ